MQVVDVPIGQRPILVVHTDEKHPSKKRKSDKKFVIASAGRSKKTGKSSALHANLADSNGTEALKEHYKEMIENGLDANKVGMVVTDMLPAYKSVIAQTFPNALHQYCRSGEPYFPFHSSLKRFFLKGINSSSAGKF